MPEFYNYVLDRRTWFAECQTKLTGTFAVTILFGATCVCVSGCATERPTCGVRALAVTIGRSYE